MCIVHSVIDRAHTWSDVTQKMILITWSIHWSHG